MKMENCGTNCICKKCYLSKINKCKKAEFRCQCCDGLPEHAIVSCVAYDVASWKENQLE